MSNPLKYFEHGQLYFITSRTEDGLPFKDDALFAEVFEAILARALALYPVMLVAFTLEANHLHMLLCALNPEHVPLFVGYIKQELAHLVNRRRGRIKKTIWCEGYDSPLLDGEDEAFYYLTYIYNQSRSRRTSRCNSWHMLTSGEYTKECRRRHRTKKKSEETHTLTLSPFAWLKKLAPDYSEEEAKAILLEKVRIARQSDTPTPLLPTHEEIVKFKNPSATLSSEEELARDELYVPKKRGQRTYCICWNKERRIRYLQFIKESIRRCREVLKEWRRGNYHEMWPPGFFPPNALRRANPLPDD